jgi:hypothetical protein
MLQMCLSLHIFRTYVASFYQHVVYVSNGLQVFFANVSDACFKCFICLPIYVAIVASGYFKSVSDVAHGTHVGSEKGR